MENMGSWALQKFGVPLFLTTNMSESFNCVMKRFKGWKKSPIDVMVLDLWKIAKFFHVRVLRGLYRRGDYTLRDHLVVQYPQDGAKLLKCEPFPEPRNCESLISRKV